MSKQRLIVKLPRPVLGLTKPQRDHIKAEIREWYEGGADPLLIPTDCEVYGFTDEWEHDVDCVANEPEAAWIAITEREIEGWQLCGTIAFGAHNLYLYFKRPKPLEDPDDE
jgi:hypothetical protein